MADKPRKISPASLKALEKNKWKPGQSGNPAGRPKNLVTDAYRELLGQPFPGDTQGRTYAQLIALAQVKEAIRGETKAAIEITDRTEGKSRQEIELTGADGGPITHTIRFGNGERDE